MTRLSKQKHLSDSHNLLQLINDVQTVTEAMQVLKWT